MDNRNQASNVNYILDAYVAGYDVSFFKTLTGTDPVAASGVIPFNANVVASRGSFKYLDVEFNFTVPTDPTAGDVRRWGLLSPAMDNAGAIYFDITDDVFSIKVYDESGTALLDNEVGWDSAAWTAEEIKYRIKWNRDVVEFWVDDTRVGAYRVDPTIQHTLTTYPLPIYINNTNADDLKLSALVIRDARFVQSPNDMGVSTIAGSDIQLGAVEIKDATSDTRAIVSAANTARTATDNVLLVQPINAGGAIISGGGASAGGGNNTYSTEQGDFTATVTDSTYNIVLSTDSIGGQAITAANFANGILKIMDVSLTPDEYKTVALDKFTWTAATKTLDITDCTGAFTLGTGDVVSLTLTGPDKMRDSSTDAQRASLIRDTSDQFVSETLIDTTNITGAPTTYYYPSSAGLSMDGYSSISIQGMITGGITATLEATNDDAASPDWVDVTKAYTDIMTAVGGGASFVDTNFLLVPTLPTAANVKNIRIKIVASDSTNAVQLNIRRVY